MKKAAKLLLDCPKLTVAKAMLAERFTISEADDLTLQMKVRRHLKDITPSETVSTAASTKVPNVVAAGKDRPVSPLTSPSTVSRGSSSASAASSKARALKRLAKKAGAKQIRMTSGQAPYKNCKITTITPFKIL